MSSITADRPRTNSDIEWLRHPDERAAFLACVFANITIFVVALIVIFASADWLATHPVVGVRVETFRAVAIGIVLAFPATAFGRHVRLYDARGNGIRVSPTQFPELHATLLRVCERLGVEKVPDLYIGRVHHDEVMEVHSIWHHEHAIVLNSDWLVDKHWTLGLDWMSFILARGVGAIRLGHTYWWMELLTVYVRHIPGLRTPLLVSWTYSRDRCAAYAVPDGLRGLLIEATGKDMIWTVDLEEFVEQPAPTGFWAWLATMERKRPHLVDRARELYAAGLFDRERDRARAEQYREHIDRLVDAITSASAE